jgi:hypothetical protein
MFALLIAIYAALHVLAAGGIGYCFGVAHGLRLARPRPGGQPSRPQRRPVVIDLRLEQDDTALLASLLGVKGVCYA